MEQKKTLWIVAASGVFLLVVVGAALLLSLQKNGSPQNNFNPSDGWISSAKAPDINFTPGVTGQNNFQNQAAISPAENSFEGVSPIEGAKSEIPPAQIDPNTPIKASNVTVIADNTLVYGSSTTTTIDLNTLKSNPVAATSVTPKNSYTAEQMGTTNTENVSPAVTQNTKTVSASAKTSKSSDEKYYAPVTKQTTPKKEAEKTVATAKSTAKTTVKATTATQQKPASFWIQVGSYEAKKSADEARTILENNKIQNEVFTYTNAKGKLFYRVRVGPYTTKSEAEYWKNKISELKEFEKAQSYVVQN